MTIAHAHHLVRLAPVLASDAAFAVTFGIFIVALIVLIVIVVTWAIRRDRAGRAAWSLRQQSKVVSGKGEGEGEDVPPKGPA